MSMENEKATKRDIRELRSEIGELRQEIQAVESRVVDKMTELVRDVETKLLNALHGYGQGQASPLPELDSNEHLDEVMHRSMLIRMAAIERRTSNLVTNTRY